MANKKGGRRYGGVKTVIAKTYAALDGTVFNSPEEAAAHSAKNAFKSLYKMSETHIDDILNGRDKTRADLILSLGARIRRWRESDPSYVKRPRKAKAAAAEVEGDGEERQVEAFEGEYQA